MGHLGLERPDTEESEARLFAGFDPRRQVMDTTTLLIIVIVVLLLGGGGWYGRGRWY